MQGIASIADVRDVAYLTNKSIVMPDPYVPFVRRPFLQKTVLGMITLMYPYSALASNMAIGQILVGWM